MRNKMLALILILIFGKICAQDGHSRYGKDFPLGAWCFNYGASKNSFDYLSKAFSMSTSSGGLNSFVYDVRGGTTSEKIADVKTLLAITPLNSKILLSNIYHLFRIDTRLIRKDFYDDEAAIDYKELDAFLQAVSIIDTKNAIVGYYIDEPWWGANNEPIDLREFIKVKYFVNKYSKLYVGLSGGDARRVIYLSVPEAPFQNFINWGGNKRVPPAKLEYTIVDGDEALTGSITYSGNDFNTYPSDVLMIDNYSSDLTVWKDLLHIARQSKVKVPIHAITCGLVRNFINPGWQPFDVPVDYPNHRQMHDQIEFLKECGFDGIWLYAVSDETYSGDANESGLGFNSYSGNWTSWLNGKVSVSDPYWTWNKAQWCEAVSNQIDKGKEVVFTNKYSAYLLTWDKGNALPRVLRLFSNSYQPIDLLTAGKYSADDNVLNNSIAYLQDDYYHVGIFSQHRNDAAPSIGTLYSSSYPIRVTAITSGYIGGFRTGLSSHSVYKNWHYNGQDEVFIGTSDGGVFVNYDGTWGKNINLFSANNLYNIDTISLPTSKVTALATGYVHGIRDLKYELTATLDTAYGYTPVQQLFVGYENGRVLVFNGLDNKSYLTSRSSPVSYINCGDIDGDGYDDVLIGYLDGNLDWNPIGKFDATTNLYKYSTSVKSICTAFNTSNVKKDIFVGTADGRVYKKSLEDAGAGNLIILNRGVAVTSFCSADVNGDGWEEVIAGFADGSISVYMHSGECNTFKIDSLVGEINNLIKCNYFSGDGGPDGLFHVNLISLRNAKEMTTSLISRIDPIIKSNDVLFQNYPNPFNPATKIKFALKYSANVKVKVYDLLGRELDVLIDDFVSEGEHEIVFNGEKYASGVYLCKMVIGDKIYIKKMNLVK